MEKVFTSFSDNSIKQHFTKLKWKKELPWEEKLLQEKNPSFNQLWKNVCGAGKF